MRAIIDGAALFGVHFSHGLNLLRIMEDKGRYGLSKNARLSASTLKRMQGERFRKEKQHPHVQSLFSSGMVL
jgi:hypothetical protein